MQGPLQVLGSWPCTCLVKSECLTAGAMLQSFVLFSFRCLLLLWQQFLGLMTTGIIGKMYLLGPLQVCSSRILLVLLQFPTCYSETFIISLLPFCAGLTVASFCYLQFFPPPYDVDGILFFIPLHNASLQSVVYILYNHFLYIFGVKISSFKN